jgi:hypothetical protein
MTGKISGVFEIGFCPWKPDTIVVNRLADAPLKEEGYSYIPISVFSGLLSGEYAIYKKRKTRKSK